MTNNRILIGTLCALAAAAVVVSAADLSKPRLWTSLSGSQVAAVFVRLADDAVVLRDRSGALFQIPRAKLSLDDQALLDEAFGPVAAAPAPAEFVAPAEPEAPAVPPAATSTADASSAPTGTVSATGPSSYGGDSYSYDSPYPRGATEEEKALIDSPNFDLVPSKWFNHFKDHEKVLELQKQSGACMLVYFKNLNVGDEKGLCGWFEKEIANSPEWRKAMKYYLKIEIPVAGGNDVLEELVARYRVNKTPAVFVAKPGSTRFQRILLFEKPATGLKPLEPSVVVDAVKAASTPAYQTLF